MAKRLSTGLRNRLAGLRTNLVSNGNFETNTTGWTGVNANLSLEAGAGVGASQALKIANSASSAGKAYTDITTVVGGLYRLKASVDVGDADSVQVIVGTTADDDAIYTSPAYTDTAIAEKHLSFVATSTTTRVSFVVGSTTTGQFVIVDGVEIEEVFDGIGDVFKNAKIAIFTGTQPSSADNAATGTLLCTVTKDGEGDGLEWASAVAGAISKPSADVWQGTNVATGAAGWFRIYVDGDSIGTISTIAPRLDGAIGTSGQELNLEPNVNLVEGAKLTLNNVVITVPAT